MQPLNMKAQNGLDLFFTVLLACSRLQDGGEWRQSGREKKTEQGCCLRKILGSPLGCQK